MDAATNTATPDAAGFHGGIGTNVVWTNQGWSGRAATFNGVSSGFQIPALTEVNRATGLTFGAWIPAPPVRIFRVMGKTANGNSCFYLAISTNGWIDVTVDRTDGTHLNARTNGVIAVANGSMSWAPMTAFRWSPTWTAAGRGQRRDELPAGALQQRRGGGGRHLP